MQAMLVSEQALTCASECDCVRDRVLGSGTQVFPGLRVLVFIQWQLQKPDMRLF